MTTDAGTGWMVDGAAFAREALGWEPDETQGRLLRAPHARLLMNCTRQWGKSTVTASKAVHRAWSRPGSLVLVASPSERQSALLVRKVREFALRLGERAKGDGDNRRSVLFGNGSRVVGIPASEDTIVGFSAVSLLVVDEAARMRDEVYDAVSPMLAVSRGDIWILSTPKGRRGFFYDLWSRGGPRWKRVSVKATECARIPAEFLAEERARMTEARFAREYLCEFGEEEGRLFSDEVIEKMFGPRMDTNGHDSLRRS